MIEWRAVTIGFILAIILGIAFGAAGGTIGSYIGVIIAGMVVGYMVDRDVMNGIVHGALIGVIGGIILAILVIIVAVAVGGAFGALIAIGGMVAIIFSIILWAVLGAVGGAIGAAITSRRPEPRMMGESGMSSMGEKRGTMEKEHEMGTMGGMSTIVAFNMENLQKCICGKCPVQAESECAMNKMETLKEMMESREMGEMPKPEDVPGMYCATGMATCGDLDQRKLCNCPNCDVWNENKLASGEPTGYFCRDGHAR